MARGKTFSFGVRLVGFFSLKKNLVLLREGNFKVAYRIMQSLSRGARFGAGVGLTPGTGSTGSLQALSRRGTTASREGAAAPGKRKGLPATFTGWSRGCSSEDGTKPGTVASQQSFCAIRLLFRL